MRSLQERQQDSIIGRIAELNNFALACMNTNKLKDAINFLVQALQLRRDQHYHDLGSPRNNVELLVASYSPLSQQAHDHAATHLEEEPHEYYPVSLTSLPSLTRLSHAGTPASIATDHDNYRSRALEQKPFHYSSGRKYHQPFLAFQEMDRAYTSTTSYWSKITSLTSESDHFTTAPLFELLTVVIFNCALCHDLLASSVVSSTRRKGLRAKAMALCVQVVDLYFESSSYHCMMIEEDENADPLVYSITPRIVRAQQDIMVMAAVNNLIQMHHESSLERKNYIQLMMSLFQVVQSTDYGEEGIQWQVDLQVRVFISNSILPSNIRMGTPASAA